MADLINSITTAAGTAVGSIVGGALGTVSGIVKSAAIAMDVAAGNVDNTFSLGAASLFGDPTNLVQYIRSKGLPTTNFGAIENAVMGKQSVATFASDSGFDWRVKLSLPNVDSYWNSPVMIPLWATGGVVFPYTPQVTLKHKASYNSLETVHNNFPFAAYMNSAIEDITIQGDFYVEDASEAAYWLAMNYYFSGITKMAYGQTANTGSPPPVVYLSGYGQHVLNKIPVVITDYSVNLPSDVDYISTTPLSSGSSSGEPSYVPVKSNIAVTCRVLYSREQVRKFSLDAFVNGTYVLPDNGGVGFL